MDRTRATRSIHAGLWALAFALILFAVTFWIAVIYIN